MYLCMHDACMCACMKCYALSFNTFGIIQVDYNSGGGECYKMLLNSNKRMACHKTGQIMVWNGLNGIKAIEI